MTPLRRPATVASETIDDESIVIDIVSGAYYSFRGWSAWAWQALSAGLDPTEVGSIAAPRTGIEAFVTQLLEHQLLVPRGEEPPTEVAPAPDGDPELLTFERYDDLADMILLDPVHDVDRDSGWPRAAEPR